MSDIEDRLRQAMAAADRPAPAGLLQGIRRRHRRHLWRAGLVWMIAVAVSAAATPSIAHALWSTRPPASHAGSRLVLTGQPAATGSTACPGLCGPPPSAGRAAPGTVLRDCASENYSDLSGSNWQARSVRAGPLWFVYARSGLTQIIAVRAGQTVVVRVAPRARSRFLFLPSANASPRQGRPGATFAACSESEMGPITLWWIGYVNHGLRCVPFQVQTLAARHPLQVVVPVGRTSCKRS